MARTSSSPSSSLSPSSKKSAPRNSGRAAKPRSPARSKRTSGGNSASAGNAASAPIAPVERKITQVKRRVVGIGGSVTAWGKAHPVQATLAVAAVVAGIAALASYMRHRQAGGADAQTGDSGSGTGFSVEDLVTSQAASPAIPDEDGDSSISDITPTRERTTPSHRFRPIRQP